MKQGRNLKELAAELEAQNAAKRDFVAPAKKVTVNWAPRVEKLSGLQMNLAGGEKGRTMVFPMQQLAEEQLARRTDIPVKYFNRMKDAAPELLTHNVNHWLGRDDGKMMVRTLYGNTRAVLSERYRPLDNHELASAVLPVLGEKSVMIASCEVTEGHLYIKAVSERVQMEVKKGDVVQAGIVISNSEVGLGAVKIEPMVYRLVCMNGMIAPTAMKRYHVGRGAGDGSDDFTEYLADATRVADDKAFWMKVRDIVNGSLKHAMFKDIVSKLQLADRNKINAKPTEVVEVVQNRFALSEGERDGVLMHLMKGEDLTQYALVNAVTRASQDVADYDRATAMERIGGEILELKGRSWATMADGIAA